MNIITKEDTNPNLISKTRIKQLKSIVKDNPNYTKLRENGEMLFDKDEIREVIKANKNHVKKGIQELICINEVNNLRGTPKKLKSFVNNFVMSLNKEEINNLYRLIEFYKKRYSDKIKAMDDFHKVAYEAPGDTYSKMFGVYESKNIGIMLYNILSLGIILPTSSNQADFNKEMKAIIYRLEKNILNHTQGKYIVMDYINPTDIIDSAFDSGSFSIEVSHNLRNIISMVGIKSYFGSQDPDAILERQYDDHSMSFKFSKIGYEGISRNEFIDFMDFLSRINKETSDTGFDVVKTGEGSYFLKSNRQAKLFIDVGNSLNNNEGGELEETFEASFYTKANKLILESQDFLDVSLKLFQEGSEFIANALYAYLKDTYEMPYPKIPEFINFREAIKIRNLTLSILEDEESQIVMDSKKIDIESTNQKVKLIVNPKEEELINKIIDLIKDREYYENFGLDIPSGRIIYGPPGTGKTLTATKVAAETNTELMIINASEIKSMYVREGEKNMQKQFTQAQELVKKGKKVIMFFDEADDIGEKRGDIKTHNEGIVTNIISNMDGIDKDLMKDIFVIFTTNRIEYIDPAIKRRFNYVIKLDLPDDKQRQEHFKLNMDILKEKSRKSLALKGLEYTDIFDPNIDLEILTKKTAGKSGSFINKLIINTTYTYSHNKKNNPDISLINTQDILNEIEFLESTKIEDKKMGFL